MKKNKLYLSDNMFMLLTSTVLVVMLFSIFLGQFLFSDIVTFGKMGDQLQLCFPSFIKLGHFIKDGIFFGVDTGTFNGATEFFLRAQIPVRYLPMMFFAYLGQITGETRVFYVLFHAIHFWISLYFTQKLGKKFFGFSRKTSFLLMVSLLPLVLYEMWYISHAIVTFLVFPLFYFSIFIGTRKINLKYWILLPFPYILGLTSGYMTLSLSLVVFVIIVTLLYIVSYTDIDIKIAIKRLFLPLIIAGGISFLYYLNVLFYIKKIVKPSLGHLNDAVALNFKLKDIPHIFLNSYVTVSSIEQLMIVSLGIVWGVVIFLFFKYRTYLELKKEKMIFYFGIITNILLLLVAAGKTTPLGAWFYMLPILGQTHLPIRYMMITLPFLYLSLCIGKEKLKNDKGKLEYKFIAIVLCGIAFIFAMVSSKVNISFVFQEQFILEIIMLSIVLFFVYMEGWESWKVILMWSLMIIFWGTNQFFEINEVYQLKNIINERTLVYDIYGKEQWKIYLDRLKNEQKKKRYKMGHLNTKESVPIYIPGNIEWYNDVNFVDITNYLGYELHLCVPRDYRDKFGWFDILDYEYILNSRSDFIIADMESIEKNSILENIVNWEKSDKWLNNNFRICQLKKFIPTYYTKGKMFIEDFRKDVLDNGYFYSPVLKNDNILEFSTNDATYYKVKIDTKKSIELGFLLYPNKHYKYYIDGEEINPILHNMQAYIFIPEGIHEIQIKYEHILEYWAVIIMNGYYIICLGIGSFLFTKYLVCLKKLGKVNV